MLDVSRTDRVTGIFGVLLAIAGILWALFFAFFGLIASGDGGDDSGWWFFIGGAIGIGVAVAWFGVWLVRGGRPPTRL